MEQVVKYFGLVGKLEGIYARNGLPGGDEMSLTQEYIKKAEEVNNSRTENEHAAKSACLHAWTDGVLKAGGKINLAAADMHYLDQGIDRPMCCGVWLDWEPE